MNPDSDKSRVNFEHIKKTTDIVRVIESYGIQLKKSGENHVGFCPFHDDTRKPNLSVTPATGLWRCFGCNATGNVMQFVERKEGISLRDAALKICTSIPGVMRASELPTAGEKEVDAATRSRLLARVAAFYAKTLRRDRAGLEYLAARKLADAALLEAFQVGYCNGSLRDTLPKSGEIIEQLKAIGILNDRGNEVFYGRVVVPIFECEPHGQMTGNIVGLYGRRLDDDEPRHLYLRGERRGVFNAAATRALSANPARTLIVTEAIFDAMSLWVAGHRNAIALYGKDGWTADHEKLIAENGVTEIVLALDNDTRGQEAADALETKLRGLVQTVRRVTWPEGVKDANAFFSSREPAAFASLLAPEQSVEAPQTKEPSASDGEAIEMREGGFAAFYGNRQTGLVRRYELCAIERPSAAKLRATVKALSDEPGRFHIDTVDFYLSRSRKVFVSEAARLFRESSEVIEGDVNRLITQLENYVAQRLEKKEVALVAEADQQEAQRLGRSHDLIAEIQSDLDKLGLSGEETNRLFIYFAMTSRKMDDPLAVLILSGSGAGKSHLQDAVLSLCPDEDLIKLTSLSGQALFYKGEDSLRHKCLAIAEVAGAEDAGYALRNLISEKKITKETTVTNAQTGRLETQLNTVYGPSSICVTTTKPDSDPETKSRYVILSVDESPEQTRAILEMQRNSHTLEGRKRKKQREAVQARHHAFQRLLKPIAVVNPFESLLSYGDGAGRLTLRRDQPKYLNLILAVTFLHQMQREVKHDEFGEYIETTLEDIAIANGLAAELFGPSMDDLSSPSRDLLRLIGDYVSRRAAELKCAPGKVAFTRRELREAIQWTEARLRLHLGELMRMEYIGAVSGRFGQRYCHQILVDLDEIDLGDRCVSGLKSVEQLGKEANLASQNANLAKRNANLATTSQPQSCEVLPPAEPHRYRTNGHAPPNLAGKNEMLIRSFA